MNGKVKMTTQLQTVEITMAGSTNMILSLEMFPICPISGEHDVPVYLDAPNGDEYSWHPSGDAYILSKDGTFRYFWKKPTIKDSIQNEFGHFASYTRFFKDGSVENKLNNMCYWWGPTSDGKEVIGTAYKLCAYCNNKNCYEKCLYDDEECYTCGRLCCWGECREYRYR